ncbi:NUDIX domain-containing protein [Streptomyces sp. NPDC051684]|uniref:NUDIX hydrolase n=1 Tax=Streptomyces sp. NPDC051684 TaxID=3365670 RepID=UPI0037A239C0
MTQPRIRVAAYVIRDAAGPELLVFDHLGMPEAGTQIPAGGVKAGEDHHTAVLRETFEETGLSTALVVGAVAEEDKPHPETGQPRRTTFFHLQVGPSTLDSWVHRVRGGGEDDGMAFACRFVPLPLEHALADEQDTWLSHIEPAWTTGTSRA